ncbi:Cof-like hydrolase [Anaerovibrio sp. JC8]|uniref:Cof-type HAD-IIB family hydrolase n=1 Tax=Anaerovibrio sp. JC8 TaxID=1240085 RepID=UPI000A0DC3E2|nr:Cof-type HAD-IIB family hydrolase [Anaerovibrio sp. JC8]ORT99236.1 Cof-like hydrolase [Anaerovibrio sp. JC8]
MKAKLFVTDMDGTLLNSQRQINEGVKKAIKKAVEAGVIFTIATGRMHISALPYVKDLGVNVPVITYNGALIKTLEGEELFASYLDRGLVEELVAFAESKGLYIQVYSDDKLYYREENDKSTLYRGSAGVEGHAVGDDLPKYMNKVPKLLIIADNSEKGDQIVEEVSNKFGDRIVAVKSTHIYIELIKPGVNKASAIARLAEKYNIPMESVLAIGDSNNDLTMIEAAGFGVAMGNANENVKKIAGYEVADCDHDGVAEAIERFCLD